MPGHRRLKDWRLCVRSNAGEQRATGLNNPSPASATARVVPSRPAPMMETSGFSFLFVSGIGIFNVQTLSQLRRESQSLFARKLYEQRTTKAPNLCIIDCASGFSENVRLPLPSGRPNILEVFQMNNFSRATSAFVLTASLLASSVAVAAQTTATKPAEGDKDHPNSRPRSRSQQARRLRRPRHQPSRTSHFRPTKIRP